VLERSASDVLWSEPRDVSFVEAQKPEPPGADPDDDEWRIHGKNMLVRTGRVFFIDREEDPEAYRQHLTARSGKPFPGVDWPFESPGVGYDFGEAVSSGKLPTTDVVPYTAVPIVGTRNTVYCATFQLAWDECRGLVGGDPLLLDVASPFADAMNAASFPRDALAADSYTVHAGRISEGIDKEIAGEMSRKFPNARRELGKNPPYGTKFMIYVYLVKNLPFQEKFKLNPEPFPFQWGSGEAAVEAFGTLGADMNVRNQVTVLDYVSDDDFIIRIDAGHRRDGIVLAKIAPKKTLGETLASVRGRIKQPAAKHKRREVEDIEPIAVPVLTLNVERDFHELSGRCIANLGPDGLPIWGGDADHSVSAGRSRRAPGIGGGVLPWFVWRGREAQAAAVYF